MTGGVGDLGLGASMLAPPHLSYILRGVDLDGREMFYTGKAGQGWVSPDRSNAFEYVGLEAARRKATLFNSREKLHGLWFMPVGEWQGL